MNRIIISAGDVHFVVNYQNHENHKDIIKVAVNIYNIRGKLYMVILENSLSKIFQESLFLHLPHHVLDLKYWTQFTP